MVELPSLKADGVNSLKYSENYLDYKIRNNLFLTEITADIFTNMGQLTSEGSKEKIQGISAKKKTQRSRACWTTLLFKVCIRKGHVPFFYLLSNGCCMRSSAFTSFLCVWRSELVRGESVEE